MIDTSKLDRFAIEMSEKTYHEVVDAATKAVVEVAPTFERAVIRALDEAERKE